MERWDRLFSCLWWLRPPEPWQSQGSCTSTRGSRPVIGSSLERLLWPANNQTKKFVDNDYYTYLYVKSTIQGQLLDTPIRDKVNALKHLNPTKTTRMRDGNILLEVPNKQEYDKAMLIRSIGQTSVHVTPHYSMNQSQGVITAIEMNIFESNEDICDFFRPY